MNQRLLFCTGLLWLLLCLPLTAMQFWVGRREDRIVVYRVDDPEPWHVSDAIVPRLPARDRLRLRRGFTAADEASLWAALEDYTA